MNNNAHPKLKYDNNKAVYYTYYKGVYVELLAVKLISADFKVIQHYYNLARIELNSLHQSMNNAAKAA